jgi:hypothetical protein
MDVIAVIAVVLLAVAAVLGLHRWRGRRTDV